jgi:large subunit ribosomal protein L10
MPTTEKVTTVDQLTRRIRESKSVFLTDFTGLNVEEINNLRRAFKKASVHYEVVKNTLAGIASKSAEYEKLVDFLHGPTALAFGVDDPSAPARVIKEFKKSSEKLQIKACLFEGVLIGPERLNEIANLPKKEVLLGRMVGSLYSPLTRLVFSLNGMLTKLVVAIDAVKKQKEQSQN